VGFERDPATRSWQSSFRGPGRASFRRPSRTIPALPVRDLVPVGIPRKAPSPRPPQAGGQSRRSNSTKLAWPRRFPSRVGIKSGALGRHAREPPTPKLLGIFREKNSLSSREIPRGPSEREGRRHPRSGAATVKKKLLATGSIIANRAVFSTIGSRRRKRFSTGDALSLRARSPGARWRIGIHMRTFRPNVGISGTAPSIGEAQKTRGKNSTLSRRRGFIPMAAGNFPNGLSGSLVRGPGTGCARRVFPERSPKTGRIQGKPPTRTPFIRSRKRLKTSKQAPLCAEYSRTTSRGIRAGCRCRPNTRAGFFQNRPPLGFAQRLGGNLSGAPKPG